MDPQGGGGGHHGFQQWQWSGGQGGFPFGEGFNPFGDDGGQYSFKFNFGWKLERLILYIYFFCFFPKHILFLIHFNWDWTKH